MDLSELLYEYRNLTLRMMKEIDENNDIGILLKEREDILKKIALLNIDRNDMKREFENLKLEEIEEKVQITIKRKMLEVRNEIKKIKRSQEAYKKYADFNGNAMIFSTKI